MIGGATMGAVLPANPAPAGSADPMPAAASAPATATDPASQPANATSADQASAPSPPRPDRTGTTRDDRSPPATTPATSTACSNRAPPLPRRGPVRRRNGDKRYRGTDPPATAPTSAQAPSLADQLLGLLGLLAPAPPIRRPPRARVPTPRRRPQPCRAPRTRPCRRSHSRTPRPDPVASPPGRAGEPKPCMHCRVRRSRRVHRRPRNARRVRVRRQRPHAIAMRDPTPSLSAPSPLPNPVDRLPSVPQPALMQPANPNAGYGDDLGSSVVWMAEHRVGHAALQVSPDHLGPIEVRLQIDGARVHAEFFSAQPEVRHALESSLPRLRDLLGQQGLQLGPGRCRPAPAQRHAARADGRTRAERLFPGRIATASDGPPSRTRTGRRIRVTRAGFNPPLRGCVVERPSLRNLDGGLNPPCGGFPTPARSGRRQIPGTALPDPRHAPCTEGTSPYKSAVRACCRVLLRSHRTVAEKKEGRPLRQVEVDRHRQRRAARWRGRRLVVLAGARLGQAGAQSRGRATSARHPRSTTRWIRPSSSTSPTPTACATCRPTCS